MTLSGGKFLSHLHEGFYGVVKILGEITGADLHRKDIVETLFTFVTNRIRRLVSQSHAIYLQTLFGRYLLALIQGLQEQQ